MTNYQTALDRIKRAQDTHALQKLDKSLERLYACGAFTVSEYMRLDIKLVDKLALMENENAHCVIC